jgi:hypothetical protein
VIESGARCSAPGELRPLLCVFASPAFVNPFTSTQCPKGYGFFIPLMAHPSIVNLWASALKGAKTGCLCLTRAARRPRRGSAGTQSCEAQDQCAMGARFLFVTFLCANKEK